MPLQKKKLAFLSVELSKTDALRASPLGELFRPGKLASQNAGADSNWTKARNTMAGHEFFRKPL
jgi:hypothetical protein